MAKKKVDKKIANKIKSLRLEREWSQSHLAKASGIHVQMVGFIERRERAPSVLILTKLAKAFSIELTRLF